MYVKKGASRLTTCLVGVFNLSLSDPEPEIR